MSTVQEISVSASARLHTADKDMKNVWVLAGVVALYGIGNGLMVTATPQASIALHQSSKALGILGSCIPLGYAASCLLCGRLFQRIPAKYVLLGGVLAGITAVISMANARTVEMCVASQIAFGLAGGAFWPFASAWMLDFESEDIPRTRLLRYYNIAWTSGTSLGLFTAGLICQHGYVFDTFYVAATVIGIVFVCACIPRVTQPQFALTSAQPDRPHKQIALPLLLAAVIGNLCALGTRAIIVNNYAELNQALNFGAERMGLFTATMIMSQLVAFSFGNAYERRLGLRRTYSFIAASLIAVNLAFAFTSNLAILLSAIFLHGMALAMSFQSGILAGIGYFSSRRTGTTIHESVVGVGGISALLAGQFVSALKTSGTAPLDALRAPYLLMAVIIAAVLAAQMILTSTQPERKLIACNRSKG